MTVTPATARRMFELLEPICLVTFFCEEANEHLGALGFTNYWDGYFASRAAPLGRVEPEVVHAAFFNFGDGEARWPLPYGLGPVKAVDYAGYGAALQGSTLSLPGLRAFIGQIG